MSDLIERLEVAAQWDDSPSSLIHEAIARIAALSAGYERLRKALEPFAAEADQWSDSVPDEHRSLCTEPGSDAAIFGSETVFTLGDLRAARRALTGGKEDG